MPGGGTALHRAAEWGHEETVGVLLEHGATMDIWTAATLGRRYDVETLLKGDRSLLNRYDNQGPPLHRAVGRGNPSVVQLLVKQGAAMEAVTVDGATPLILALWSGHQEVARYLAAKGADVHAMDRWATEPWVATALAQ